MARKFQTNGRSSGKTLLLVDDSLEYLEATKLILEREGHTVLTADNGPKAIEILKNCIVDLLLLDYFMPGMTGEEVVEQIRTFNPYLQVILQTGYASERPPRELLRRLDIQGYHDKSEGPDKLLLWTDVGLKSAYAVQLLAKSRLGLDYILSATPELYKIQPLDDLLRGILLQISGLLDITHSFLAVLPTMARCCGVEGFLAMVEGEGADLRVHAGLGKYGDMMSVGDTVDATAYEAIKFALQKGDFNSEPQRSLVPLKVGEMTLGVIYLEKEINNPADLELLRVFANQAAVAIQNSQLYEMATIDTLTGVFVRRFFDQWVARELRTALRAKKPVSLLMLDMDNMKGINDTAGHVAGDSALVQFAGALREATRCSDFIGRFGGDEFSVLLPNSFGEGTEIVINRIFELVHSKRVEYPEGEFYLKASLGSVMLKPPDGDFEAPLTKEYFQSLAAYLQCVADQSLYEAKRAGRDRFGPPAIVAWPTAEELAAFEARSCAVGETVL